MSLEFERPAGVEQDDGDFASMLEKITEGDDYMGKREYSSAEESYKEALTAAYGFYGALSPVVLPILLKVGEAQLADCQDEDHFSDLTRTWQRALAIAQLKHGPESAELIPIIKQTIAVYDLQGAHVLSGELLQRLQMLQEAQPTA